MYWTFYLHKVTYCMMICNESKRLFESSTYFGYFKGKGTNYISNITCIVHPQYHMYRTSNITYIVHYFMSLQWTNNKLSKSVSVQRWNNDSVSQNNEQSVWSRRTDIQQWLFGQTGVSIVCHLVLIAPQ